MNTQAMGHVIRHCRQQSGLSQIQLAKLAGIGKTALFDLEKGKETVQLNTLLKVLDSLNIKIKLESPLIKAMENQP